MASILTIIASARTSVKKGLYLVPLESSFSENIMVDI